MAAVGSGFNVPGGPTRSPFVGNAPRFANGARNIPGIGGNLAVPGLPNAIMAGHTGVIGAGGGMGTLAFPGFPNFSSLSAGDMRNPSMGAPMLSQIPLPARAESGYAQHPVQSFMQRLAAFNPYQRQQFTRWVQAVQASQRPHANIVQQYAQPVPIGAHAAPYGDHLMGHPNLPMNQLHTSLAARAEQGNQHPVARALLSALSKRF